MSSSICCFNFCKYSNKPSVADNFKCAQQRWASKHSKKKLDHLKLFIEGFTSRISFMYDVEKHMFISIFWSLMDRHIHENKKNNCINKNKGKGKSTIQNVPHTRIETSSCTHIIYGLGFFNYCRLPSSHITKVQADYYIVIDYMVPFIMVWSTLVSTKKTRFSEK